MKVLQPDAELVSVTPNAESVIEYAGRTCYKSEDQITTESAERFIKMISARGHRSVLEHVSATIKIFCDRGVTHEIVRHRIASYSQESTRYCNYAKDKFSGQITVIQPPQLTENWFHQWHRACSVAEECYMNMVNDGCPAQIARAVLPTCLKTEIVMTANFREWLHFLRLRTSPAAHPQMVEIAMKIKAILQNIAPNVFTEENINVKDE